VSGTARTGDAPRPRLVVVLADGLRDDTARQGMGYLHALEAAGRARWCTLRCEMPSLSRPLYATVVTGRTPIEHGIVSNEQHGVAIDGTIFDELAAAGGTSVVAAYHWFRELLTGETFDPARDRLSPVPARGIVDASWYFEDDYPDSHLLADAEALRRRHDPSLLFVHPMGPDHAGHQHGGESAAYLFAARRLDMQLARVIPHWHAQGCDVLLTSDHGMNADRMHGGSADVERLVPFVWMPHAPHAGTLDDVSAWPDDQRGVRAFLAARLGLGLAEAADTADTADTATAATAPAR
jgi:predicted AlkP superfamily pyrophosphatase or phosphodiesterase